MSDLADDPEWDDFLETHPLGHHAQTSCWGRARASIGWMPFRVVVTERGCVVGGAQMVVRPMPFGGNVGFVSRGPVVSREPAELASLVFDQLKALGRSRRVQYLVTQPPRGGDWMSAELTARGFRYGAFDIDHTATVVIDMSPSTEQLLAAMKKHTRKHIRHGQRSGVVVRRGTAADVSIFNRLKDVHSSRLGYERRDDSYYEEMWRSLTPREHVELFVAEYEGEAVSAQLAIPFGDTVRHLEGPWSGEHGSLRPNELLKWEVLRWAKSEGYRFSDLEGIEPVLADAVLAGVELPDDPSYSASRFKLSFVPPGEVVVDPPSFDYIYNPILRLGYRCIPNRVMRSNGMKRLLFRFRETGS